METEEGRCTRTRLGMLCTDAGMRLPCSSPRVAIDPFYFYENLHLICWAASLFSKQPTFGMTKGKNQWENIQFIDHFIRQKQSARTPKFCHHPKSLNANIFWGDLQSSKQYPSLGTLLSLVLISFGSPGKPKRTLLLSFLLKVSVNTP